MFRDIKRKSASKIKYGIFDVRYWTIKNNPWIQINVTERQRASSGSDGYSGGNPTAITSPPHICFHANHTSVTDHTNTGLINAKNTINTLQVHKQSQTRCSVCSMNSSMLRALGGFPLETDRLRIREGEPDMCHGNSCSQKHRHPREKQTLQTQHWFIITTNRDSSLCQQHIDAPHYLCVTTESCEGMKCFFPVWDKKLHTTVIIITNKH